MAFHINARYVLLTYAQCGDLDGFAVMDIISSLGGECIVARESHSDGGLHLHVFCDFGRKFRSRKADIFDVHDRHPNVQPSKGTPEKGYDYAIKDGDVICGGLGRPTPCQSGNRAGSTKDIWTQITGATSREQFWELCLELDPKTAATAFTQLSKFADWQYRVEEPEYSHPDGFEFIRGNSDGRNQWLSQSGIGSSEPLIGMLRAMPRQRETGGPVGGFARLPRPKRPHPPYSLTMIRTEPGLLLTSIGRCRSLCLYGGTKTGKTLWARSLGSHVYCIGLVSGTECMKAPNADYAVFDDIRGGIKFFHSFKEWLGCQMWITVKRLYREPTLIKWGKPSIWLANSDPRDELNGTECDWMNGNVDFIEIDSAIYRRSPITTSRANTQ